MNRSRLATVVRFWLPVVIWFLFISIFSTSLFSGHRTLVVLEHFLRLFIPDIARATVRLIHAALRKTAHFGEYFVLGLLMYRAFRRGRALAWQRDWALLTCGLAIALALLDEFHQLFVPGRVGSLIDSGVDSLGAVAAVLFLYARASSQRSESNTAAMKETTAEK